MKFGGTSVASADHIRHVARLITATEEKKVVVLSAMAGTTNQLVAISDQLVKRHRYEGIVLLDKLKKKYERETKLLFQNPTSYDRAWTMINRTFWLLEQLCYLENFTLFDEKKILAQGELMSTAMMLLHLEDMGKKAVIIPALDYMRTDKNAEPDKAHIKEHLTTLIDKQPDDTLLYITEGYICRNAFGDVDNLQRGGSDYTASLVGAALNVHEIQIWTDIDGMHNNDPRVVDATSPVRKLHFEEAAELAYFGAKILHPTCIQPAKDKNIPVRLLNTLEPDAPGTLISLETNKDEIKAVAAKDGITMIKIKSSHMLMSWNFMRRIFHVFEHYQVPVDMVTTSEVAVSLTVDNNSQLNNIKKELEKLGEVVIEPNMTIICVVGDMEPENVGYESKIVKAFEDIPVRMISYGGSEYNISFLVKETDKKRALISLSKNLF